MALAAYKIGVNILAEGDGDYRSSALGGGVG
jgi:hypothetical protein